MTSLRETDLYPPLKAWLEAQGYTVRGEVGRCDLAAENDGTLIVVELKLRASLTLLAQAVERQEYADSVYVALPTVDRPQRSPVSKDLRRLLARLGVGLLAVRFLKTRTAVEVLMHPKQTAANRARRSRKKAAILREIAGRDLDLSPGGLAGGRGRVSAYRQRAMRLAVWISELEEASPARLRELGASNDAGTILQRNLYGWFERIRRGVYRVHPAARIAMDQVPELADLYRRELQDTLNRP